MPKSGQDTNCGRGGHPDGSSAVTCTREGSVASKISLLSILFKYSMIFQRYRRKIKTPIVGVAGIQTVRPQSRARVKGLLHRKSAFYLFYLNIV